MKLTNIIILLLLTSCASNKSAATKRIFTIYDHAIYKDSVYNGGKLRDSLIIARTKKLNKL